MEDGGRSLANRGQILEDRGKSGERAPESLKDTGEAWRAEKKPAGQWLEVDHQTPDITRSDFEERID